MNRQKKEQRKKDRARELADAREARATEWRERHDREMFSHRELVASEREARALRRKNWLTRPRPAIPPTIDHPTFRAWIDAPWARQMWIAIGSRLLVRDFPIVIRETPEYGHDECLICAEMWPADGDYAAKHVADHAYEWLVKYGYVVPDRYEHAEVLADALAVAFARLGG